nr:MAG TPA: endonuclease [Caudoviricetes sp.]
MSLQETKECACCGKIFYKRKSDSITQWINRKFCSISCLNKSRDFIPIHLRFWKFVKRLSNESCWEWLGATDGHGYGAITNTATSSPIKAHRLSYEIHYGEIPEGKVICHHCARTCTLCRNSRKNGRHFTKSGTNWKKTCAMKLQ